MKTTRSRLVGHRRRLRRLVATGVLAASGAAAAVACSSTGTATTSGTAAPTTAPTAAPATSAPAPAGAGTTGTTAADSAVGAAIPESDITFCGMFANLAERRDGRDDFARNKDAAAWDLNIANVEAIAAVAPPEIKEQAEVYVQMVKDRKALAEANGWKDVAELPADVRSAFIREHAQMQQEVNKLIEYAKTNCEGVT